ncbi:MAG: 50S ribosomal protein L30 [Mycobacteriales bacterium]|jgi:large subunit ribosomal protein L30
MATAKTSKLKVTQIKSKIGSRASTRETLRTLGLHRINESVIKDDRPEIRGMVAAVAHLVTVEEVK